MCLVRCYCHRMRTCLLTPRHTLLTSSHYASGDVSLVSESLAAISEDDTQEQSGLCSVNRPKSESTSDLVMSHPFFTLGRLCSKPTFAEGRPTLIEHIVAVSLWDFSLWAIFDGGIRIR